MTWLLLVALGVVVISVLAWVVSRAWQAGGNAPDQTRRRCVRCGGTGWVGGGPQRTLDFDGEGFTDRHEPATMCPACGGTGRPGTS